MDRPRKTHLNVQDRWLVIDEIRLVSDLRIMHTKVDELYHVVANLRQKHTDPVIHNFADHPLLEENIRKVDEIYLWFVKLKEQMDVARRAAAK